jgi:hypothetical protein
VTIWGAGKATLIPDESCPIRKRGWAPEELQKQDQIFHGVQYPGDCDKCKHFRGAKITNRPAWGDHARACCGLKIDWSK